MKRLLATCLLTTSLSFIAGCSGQTTEGTNYTVNAGREVTAFLPFTHEQVHQAAIDVLQYEFKYDLTEQKLDGRDGVVRAITATDRRVKVESSRDSDSVTEVTVFVGGPFGDTRAAADIIAELEKRLRDEG